MTLATRTGWKIVAADGTTRNHTFHWPLVSEAAGQEPVEVEATNPTRHPDPCPSFEGDGLCLAKTVRGASSGGQSLSTAVGLLVEFDDDDVLAESGDKIRVARVRVVDVFDPVHLIRLGLCADLRGADLGYANLGYANLGGANLGGADLGYADLGYANLGCADLGYADLRGVNLRYADLRGANLEDANLGYADLRGANLGYADLRGANLEDANASGSSVWPDGFDPKSVGVNVR